MATQQPSITLIKHRLSSLKWNRNRSAERKGWDSLRDNAKRRGLVLGITREEYKELRKKPCYYCGLPFERGKVSYALDRIDNTIGYLKNNIVACCYSCNHAKAKMTLTQFVNMCHLVAENHMRIL